MLSEREQKTLKETRLRNLKRRHAKLIQHADLTNECEKVESEIRSLENELSVTRT